MGDGRGVEVSWGAARRTTTHRAFWPRFSNRSESRRMNGPFPPKRFGDLNDVDVISINTSIKRGAFGTLNGSRKEGGEGERVTYRIAPKI